MIAAGLLTIVFRFALIRVLPHPQPSCPDEFAYLLGGQIFASGHVAMPQLPHWQFFEMLHAFVHPVYAPKYPPAQSAFLAIGQLLGDPFYGVLISVALFAAATCWMLQAFVRPAWSLIGGLATALYFGAGHYWTESYWGGAAAALGAALLIGGFARLRGWIAGGAIGAGVLLLAFSRPYEGGVLILFIAGSMLVRRRQLDARVVAIAAAACVTTAILLAAYDTRITGSPWKLPYRLHMEQYSENEPFWFTAPLPKKNYANPAVASAYRYYDFAVYKEVRDLPVAERISRAALTILMTIGYDGGIGGLAPLLFVFFVRRDPEVRRLAACTFLLLASLLVEVMPFEHYMAPMLVASTALAFTILDRLWRYRPVRTRDRAVIVAILCVAVLFGPALRVARAAAGQKSPLYHGTGFGIERARVTRDILSHPGSHVVFVRWSPAKPMPGPWVANGAHMDQSRIIWAHDRGAENRELMQSFPGRHFWLLEDDGHGVRVTPYP